MCDCQAREHGLINNCLTCGKIVCEQEGEGACYFCGNLVYGRNKKSEDFPEMAKNEISSS
jgi:hypothetical protein